MQTRVGEDSLHMTQEIHLTRGSSFDDGGDEPLSQVDWDSIVEASDAIIVRRAGARLGRLDGQPLAFSDGVIAVTTPTRACIDTLASIAAAHGARLFGEGGHQLHVDGTRPPHFIRACADCGAKNRVPLFPPDGQRPKCGRCKTEIKGRS
jgi:hypothetical protein